MGGDGAEDGKRREPREVERGASAVRVWRGEEVEDKRYEELVGGGRAGEIPWEDRRGDSEVEAELAPYGEVCGDLVRRRLQMEAVDSSHVDR